MNERIRKLAIEARLLTGWPNGEVEYQKFAELIMLECIEAARTVGGSAGVEVETIIRNHFGVEE